MMGILPIGCPSTRLRNWEIHDLYTPIVRYARFLSWNWDVRNSRMSFTGVENGHLFLSPHQPAQILQGPSYRFLVLVLHDAMRMSHTVPEKPVIVS